MIKRFCDRCGKEIVGEPWYMRWYQNTMSGLGMGGAMLCSDLCSRADSVASYSNAVSQPGAPMYCDECKMAILAFAVEKPERAGTEVGDGEAVDAVTVIAEYCRGGDCDTCVFWRDGICVIAGEYLTVGEAAKFARDKLRKKNGGEK